MTFRTSGPLDPYWDKNAASLTRSAQSTGGNVDGRRVAAPSSLLATLPVGGACGLLVSLAVDAPTLPEHVIEGGSPCESRLGRLRVGVTEPIAKSSTELRRPLVAK